MATSVWVVHLLETDEPNSLIRTRERDFGNTLQRLIFSCLYKGYRH